MKALPICGPADQIDNHAGPHQRFLLWLLVALESGDMIIHPGYQKHRQTGRSLMFPSTKWTRAITMCASFPSRTGARAAAVPFHALNVELYLPLAGSSLKTACLQYMPRPFDFEKPCHNAVPARQYVQIRSTFSNGTKLMPA